MSNKIIYGKDETDNIVSIEIVNDNILIFKEKHGLIETEIKPNKYWVLAPNESRDGTTVRLTGSQYYKYIKEYATRDEFNKVKKSARDNNLYCLTNPIEGSMVKHGYTFFKNTKLEDVSILSFDIETSGLKPTAHDAKVFMITNTFRKLGTLERKTFSIDEFNSEKDMIQSWTNWVQEINPSIITGFNIIGFDFPYLMGRATFNGMELELGRDCSPIKKEEFVRKFRKDGSQEYEYNRVTIFGRSIIDMWFVAIRYDIGRKYSNYKLKTIIKEEGLEKTGRTFYDAAQIRNDWKDLEKRKQIKQYAEEDADDSLKLYDLMIPAQFYLCQYIPKQFQMITESATGSQINGVMVRAYLQDGNSVARASDVKNYAGGISFGISGIYSNCLKFDIASAYPHCILQYEIYDRYKDHNGYMLEIVKHFTTSRLKDKALYKETKNKYYDDMSSAKKVFINSCYGFMGGTGLNYNYPEGAAEITKKCREIIDKALVWASGHDSEYWKNI